MAQRELEFDGGKIIASQVEVFILGISDGDDAGGLSIYQVGDDFIEYLEERGLYDYWKDTVILSPVHSVAHYHVSCGVKFDFTRTISSRGNTELGQSMAAGTQWVSDVIDLMKDFLDTMRRPENYYCDFYLDARLVFREGGQQFEWK